MSDLTTKAAEIRAGLVADWRKAMEGVPEGPWAAYMSRYEVRVDAAFIGDQEIIAMCATGRSAGKRASWIARCSPAGIAPLLALIEQQAAELAEARAEHRNIQTALAEETARTIAAAHERDGARAERNDLRGAIYGSDFFDPDMSNGFFVEMVRTLEATCKAAVARADELLREKERRGAGWLPIETHRVDAIKGPYSPHVLCAHLEKQWRRFGRYDLALKRWYYSGTDERSQWAQIEGDEPTHWMPLPELSSGQNLADAHSKSPAPSSQSERIAVLEAALAAEREACAQAAVRDHQSFDYEKAFVECRDYDCGYAKGRQDAAAAIRARSALAPLGEE